MIETAVILAAGIGARLNVLANNRPKGFIEFDGIPIVINSINILKKYGITKFIIGTGYRSEYYETYEDNSSIYCVKNHDFANSGSFRTLTSLKNKITEDFLLLESDIIYEEKAIRVLINHPHCNAILASGRTDSGDEVFIDIDNDNYLVNLSKLESKMINIYGELVGISKISYETYTKLLDWSFNHDNLASQIHYEEAFVKICKETEFFVEKIEDLIWTEIDTIEHYKRAHDYIYPKLLNKGLKCIIK